MAVNGNDTITGFESGCKSRGIFDYVGNIDIGGSLAVGHKQDRDEHKCGDEIHDRAGAQEEGPLTGCLGLHAAFGEILAVFSQDAHEIRPVESS